MKTGSNFSKSPIEAMESGYALLSQLIRAGSRIDGVVTDAMNITLAMMLAVENEDMLPEDLLENPFLKFERTKAGIQNWLYGRFIDWYRDCYPVHEDYLAMEFFMNSIKHRPEGVLRNSEISDVLTVISKEMAARKAKRSRLESGLIKDTVSCMQAALSNESAFIFLRTQGLRSWKILTDGI